METYLIISGLIYAAMFIIWSKESWLNFFIKFGWLVMVVWTVIKYVELHFKITL